MLISYTFLEADKINLRPMTSANMHDCCAAAKCSLGHECTLQKFCYQHKEVPGVPRELEGVRSDKEKGHRK